MTPLSEICQWAAGLPIWEQETLRRLMCEEPFDEKVYTHLAALLLGEKAQDPVNFSGFETQPSTGEGKPLLLKVSGAQNVNALAPNQTLEFGPNLTIIYGQNGSGKSGYARIFGNACFSRGDRDVLPNLFDSAAQRGPQSVDITISAGGRESTINHDFENSIAALSGFYVFDTTAVVNHLSRENVLSFSPLGLSLLRDLVAHTDKVRNIASDKINTATKPHGFLPLFRGETAISRAIDQLSAKTNLEEAKRLTELTPEEETQKQSAETELATLRSQNSEAAIRTAETELSQVRGLRLQLSDIESSLNERTIGEIHTALSLVETRRVKASEAGSSQFAHPKLQSVGSDAWTAFVKAAKSLASEEDGYPSNDSVCLLCQQPLSPAATAMLSRLWEFLHGEARRLLKESEVALDGKTARLKRLDTGICSAASAVHQVLAKKAPETLKAIEDFLKVAASRKEAIITAISASPESPGSEQLAELAASPQAPFESIDALLTKWEGELTVLKTRNTAQRIKELTALLLEFEHRKILGENFEAIERYVKGLKWAASAQKLVKTSRHITSKHNTMFETYVSDEFRTTFEKYITDLGRPMRVKLETRGAKATAMKALQLILPDGVNHPKASPQHILCEGEKRAVALADFLAEVTVNPSSAGIVLDDPATSLDQNWVEQIAQVVVAESKKRQVIVFTHDLYFLYLLRNFAVDAAIGFQSHWISKHETENTPGFVALNASPATERDYKNTNQAEKYLKQAGDTAAPDLKETFLRSGFGALRTTYEQFVLQEMFADVVRRFDSRISIDRLREARIPGEIVDTVMEKVGRISRFIEGHSHSDSSPFRPTCDALKTEIEDFKTLKLRHKALKRENAAPGLAPA